MIIGKYDFNEDRPYIMGILNVTPDSFSDGGLHNTMDTARAATEQMIKDGADIIDVGGESTRPGHEKISDQCEIDRVCPVIEMIKKEFDVPVSLDTYKGKVAEAGILAGADLINDIWGLKWDKDMADIIARHDKACCLMHNRDNTNYVNYLEGAIKDLDESVQMAYKAGIDENKIMVDPGIGFGKTLEQNLIMIGLTLDLPVNEREEGTITTSVIGLMKGCQFFRVHDVKANYRALKMAQAILTA